MLRIEINSAFCFSTLRPGFDGQSILLTLATHTPLNSLGFAIFALSIFVAFLFPLTTKLAAFSDVTVKIEITNNDNFFTIDFTKKLLSEYVLHYNFNTFIEFLQLFFRFFTRL